MTVGRNAYGREQYTAISARVEEARPALRGRVRAGENGLVASWGSRVIGGAVAACLGGGSAWAVQSLAEVAEKERARRAQVAKTAGESEVISEEDLEGARGDSFSVSGQASTAPEDFADEEDAANPSEASRRLSAREIRDLREKWAEIWQGQMEQAERELERARDDVYQCRAASRYFFVPLAVDCQGVDLRLASAEARLKKVRRNRYHWELLLPPDAHP